MKAALIGFFLASSLLLADTPPAEIFLPAPHKTGGKPLMEALALRSTSRSFGVKDLATQQLSDLLWAAFGVNRPNGKRTAPSARNWQETDIYVLMKSGAYRYDAGANRLFEVVAGDIRALGGTQAFVKDAPVTLVYVADLGKTGPGPAAQRQEWSAMDASFIAENVYLFCASENLVTGVRAYVDKAALGAKLGLRENQYIVLAQSVGYPVPAR
jgi:hypothetical protein